MSSRVRAASRLGSEPAASATTMLVADHVASTAALPITLMCRDCCISAGA